MSDSILIYQIYTNLYNRQEKAIKHNNFSMTLKNNSDLARKFFLELQEETKESEEETIDEQGPKLSLKKDKKIKR